MTEDVASHYSGGGGLAASILAAVREAGKDPDRLTTADLRSVDEFHIRGHMATLEIAGQLGLHPASHLLDIGSGLGGARAQRRGGERLPRHRYRPDAGLL